MACPHCGSWSVRADRSLAGRLVCGRCGQPLGGVNGRAGRSPARRRRGPSPRAQLGWWLLGLLALGAALAALPPQPGRWPAPPTAPPFPTGSSRP